MRIYSIRPVNGPSQGGTLISLIGTGFVDTSKQAIRFTYGGFSMEVTCNFDPQTDCFYCTTPKFEDVTEQNIQWPQEAKVELTLDKQIYIKAEQTFQIYCKPKCASVDGGIQLAINPANLDQNTVKSLQYLTVGFQPKIFIKPQLSTKNNFDTQSQSSQRPASKQLSSRNQPGSFVFTNFKFLEQKQKNQGPLNPLDLSISDPELDKENWICVNSEIVNDQIICTIPKLDNFHPDCLQYNIDISLNGQQFTGFPSSFRFYSQFNCLQCIFLDIKIKNISPICGTNIGGTVVKVEGEGFFDTIYKKIKFVSKLGERLIDVVWDKVNKQFNFVCPPLNWLLGSYEPTPEILNKVKEQPAKIYITFNQIEWIFIGDFSYIEPEIEKFLPVQFDQSLTEEEKIAKWKQPMEDIDPLKGIENEVELAKKKEEIRKQAELDEAEINLYKKAGQYLYIIGNNFFLMNPILVQLTSPKKTIVINGVFKNKNKIGILIPEFDELEKGIHDIQVEVSFNQQQFSQNSKKFKYLAFEAGMPEDQKKKYEDEFLKALKKPPAKK